MARPVNRQCSPEAKAREEFIDALRMCIGLDPLYAADADWGSTSVFDGIWLANRNDCRRASRS